MSTALTISSIAITAPCLHAARRPLSPPRADSLLSMFRSLTLDDEYFERRVLRATCIQPSPLDDFLPQASEIIPGLFVCDMYTATSPAVLTALGITHIVSCIKPALPTRMAGIQQICIPIDDSKQADLLGYLDYAVYWMAKAMRTKGNVVVHCMWGMSRSASIAIAYLIAVERMSLESALRLVRSKRQVVRPNAGFLRQLQVYEKVTRLREEQVIREQPSVRPRQV